MPGRNFIKSEVEDNSALAVGAAQEWDLGVNGLSHLFIALSGLQSANNAAGDGGPDAQRARDG